MKAILVINVPDDFDYNRCSIGGDGNIYYERKGEQRTSIIGNIKNLKIKNLKPMPEKEIVRGFDRYEEGWNDCIDEIIGK